jgi:hypothetical protein
MIPTDITVADWLEVIHGEDHEIPNVHPFTSVSRVEELWGSGLLTVGELVTLVEIECLKRARRDAYIPAN